MNFPGLRTRLAQRLPFYYGWVILAVASVPSFGARAVMAVATLSVFVVPMTEEFGWSRGQFSGAVSLGALFGPQAGGAMGRAAPPQPLSAAAQSLRHGAQARDRASALRDGSDPAGSSSPQGDVLLRRKASAARARAVPLAELGRPGLQ